jgi:hypothetical protein
MGAIAGKAVPNDDLAGSLARDDRAGALVFAASKGRQVSFEPAVARGLVLDARDQRRVGQDANAHGFFTGALLGAVADPETDRNADGVLQASELIDEMTARVSEVSRDAQTPWVAHREMFGDFVVAPAARP